MVGALYADLNCLFYSFEVNGKGWIQLNPQMYMFVCKHKVAIEKLNYYEWARFLEKVNSDEAVDHLLSKIDESTMRTRKSLLYYRDILFQEFENKCFYCGNKVQIGKVEVDHFIPWSFIKDDNLWNFVLACRSCNNKKRDAFRGDIRVVIDNILENSPKDMDEFIRMIQEEGYAVKRGKYISVKCKEQKGFIRLRSLGYGYREDDIAKRIAGEIVVDDKYVSRNSRKVDLLVDIQKKLAEGKTGGYERWAKVYNIKQMAKTIIFLQEHDIRDYDKLATITSSKTEYFNSLLSEIKTCEKRMAEIQKMKKHITDYARTRDVYVKYRLSGYSKQFFEEHRQEIELHKSVRKIFAEFSGAIPKMTVLNMEYAELLDKKREAYHEYQQAKKEMQDYQAAKSNIDTFLREEEKREKNKSKDNQI